MLLVLVLMLMLVLLLLLSVVLVRCVGTGVHTGDYGDGSAAGVFSKVLRFARSWG
jgi:hypothetical protein